MLYRGKNRQLLQYVLQDNTLMGYVGIVTAIFVAAVIGLYNIGNVKIFASFILPMVLYIIANRLLNSSIRTIPAILIGIGGVCFVNCYNRPHELVIALLCVGMLLTVVGVVVNFRDSRNI